MLDKDEEILYKILSVPFHVNFYSVGIDSHGTFWIGSNEGLSFWKKKIKKELLCPLHSSKKSQVYFATKKITYGLVLTKSYLPIYPKKQIYHVW